MHFLQRKLLICDSILLKFDPKGPIDNKVRISSDDGLGRWKPLLELLLTQFTEVNI